uniref:Metallo-beta-lactamase domain-containing protein 1 n=1 Tax=Ascaris lumbricoides TaxID=6252 RepID=A0A0M3HT49_ASCLU
MQSGCSNIIAVSAQFSSPELFGPIPLQSFTANCVVFGVALIIKSVWCALVWLAQTVNVSARLMTFPLFFTYLVLVVHLVTYSAQQGRSLDERLANAETPLNDFELKLLHDFVRRKGKGSVSRVPFEEIFLEHEENTEANRALNIGRQKLADRRKNKVPQTISTDQIVERSNTSVSLVPNTSVANSTPSSTRVSTGTLRTTRLENTHNSNVGAARNRNITKWTQSVEKNVPSDNDIGWLSSNNRDAEWEMKMRELTRQLSIFLSSMKRQKEIDESLAKSASEANDANNAFIPIPLATIRIIREGSVAQLGDNEYQLIASIVLISDNGTNIVVDTGLGTNSTGRADMLQTLSNLNIRPIDVHYVVTTHGHPDHSGNTNDFPDAFHYAGNYVYRRTRFNFSHLFEVFDSFRL